MKTGYLSLSVGIAGCLAWGALALAGPGHDHAREDKPAKAAADPHAGHDHGDGQGHDEKPVERSADPHAGHDHGKAGGDGHGEGHTDEVTLTAEAAIRYGVVVGLARKQAMVSGFAAPARVAFNADAMAHVGSSVTGRVRELGVKLGDAVKRGDVLAVVDSPELGEAQSDFLLKRSAAETARPAVKFAQDAYDRARLLQEESQGVAVAEVQRREGELRSAEGALATARAAATAAENKLHLYGMTQEAVATLLASGEIAPQYRVVAPIDGEVIEREVTLGELVRPDREELMVIADLRTVWVVADVPEVRMAEVRKGSGARLEMVALRGKVLEGTVTYVAPVLDANTRSARVRIEVRDEGGVLRPGMFGQATIVPAAGGEAVLAIPEAAVQNVEGGAAVFVPVEGEPGTFAKRAVSVGTPVGGMVEVFKGLEDGERLVVSGSFILKAELGKAGAAHEH